MYNMLFIYINLAERKEKNKYMHDMLKLLNVEFKRFEAVRPSLCDAIKIKNLLPRVQNYLHNTPQIPRGLGIIGCFLSHRTVLEQYRNSNHKYLCILEDDVEFNNISIKRVEDIIKSFDDKNVDWDILRSVRKFEKLDKNLDTIYKFNLPSYQSVMDDSIDTTKFAGGTHFQIINVKNIEKIINYLYHEKIFNIDSVYSTNALNIFAVSDKKLNVGVHKIYSKHTNIPKI